MPDAYTLAYLDGMADAVTIMRRHLGPLMPAAEATLPAVRPVALPAPIYTPSAGEARRSACDHERVQGERCGVCDPGAAVERDGR